MPSRNSRYSDGVLPPSRDRRRVRQVPPVPTAPVRGTLPGAHRKVTEIDSTDSPYTVLPDDEFIEADTTGGAVVINLPTATPDARYLGVKRVSAGLNALTLVADAGAGDLIDGFPTLVLPNIYDAPNLVAVTDHWSIN